MNRKFVKVVVIIILVAFLLTSVGLVFLTFVERT